MKTKRGKSKRDNTPKPTKFEAFIKSCQNNKLIFLVLVVFAIVVGLATFTDALSKIWKFFKSDSSANPQTQQTITEWQPPELPAGCKLVTVTSAGGTIRNPVTWKDWNIIGPNGGGIIITPGFRSSLSAHVLSNKFYVNADVTLDGINSYSISNLAFHGTMPAGWDRNSNSNALEIVGPDELPVFQEIYQLPEHISVNGIFPKKPGIIIGMFDTHMVSGFPDEVLTNLPNRKPIFKYPSWKYPGVLAD